MLCWVSASRHTATIIVVGTLAIIQELAKRILKLQDQKHLNQGTYTSASFRQSVWQNLKALSQGIWEVKQWDQLLNNLKYTLLGDTFVKIKWKEIMNNKDLCWVNGHNWTCMLPWSAVTLSKEIANPTGC